MTREAPPPKPHLDTLLIEIGLLRARRRYAEILALTNEVGNDILISTPAFVIARAGSLSQLRRHREALAILLDAEHSVAAAKDGWILASWRLLLAIQLMHAGKLPESEGLLRELIESATASSYPRVLADAYNSLGVCLSFRGEVDQAILLFNRSMIVWQGLGDTRGVAFSNHNIGLVLREWGNPWRAEPYLQHADLYYAAEGIIEERVSILAERSLLYCDLGDERLSKRLAQHSMVCSNALLSEVVRASALRALGIVTCRFGSATEAEEILLTALHVLGGETGGLLRGEILEELAVLAAGRASPVSQTRIKQALAAYIEVGSVRHCERLLTRTNLDSQGPQ